MMFSVYKEKIIDCLKNNTNYAIALGGGMAICIVSCLLSKSLIYRVIYEVSFCLVIVLATMHMKLKNSFLEYVGVNLFGLYILQRIPMMYFKQIVFNNKYLYISTCLLVTFIPNFLFNKFVKLIKL